MVIMIQSERFIILVTEIILDYFNFYHLDGVLSSGTVGYNTYNYQTPLGKYYGNRFRGLQQVRLERGGRLGGGVSI